jgi:hypothetical protein
MVYEKLDMTASAPELTLMEMVTLTEMILLFSLKAMAHMWGISAIYKVDLYFHLTLTPCICYVKALKVFNNK